MSDVSEATTLDAPVEGQAGEVGATGTTFSPDDLLDIGGIGDKYVEVKVDGQTQHVPLSEALSGYSRQADYTRKTQEIALERQQHADALALFEALGANPEGVITALADQLGVPLGNVPAATAPGASDEVVDTSELSPLEQKLAELEQWKAQQDQASVERELTDTLAKLHTEYDSSFGENGFNDNQFLAFAMKTNAWPLEAAMLLYQKVQGQASADFQANKDSADAAATAAAQAAGIIESGGSLNVGTQTPGGARPTLEQALQSAFDQHGGW